MRLAGLALVLLCGCTQLLGLEDVETSDRDLDADGVLDAEDNCQGTANPDQADVDGDNVGDECDVLACDEPGASVNRDVDRDGVDDGCDPCRLGFNDDEDGDGILDPCDRCPGTPDDQADKDNDGVGDACDRISLETAEPTQRVFFDGFGLGPHDWIDPAWKIESGSLAILSPGIDASVANAALFGIYWRVSISVTLPDVAEMNETLGISVRSETGGSRSCSVVADMPTGAFRLGSSLGPQADDVFLAPGSTVLLSMYPVGKTEWNCEAVKIGSDPELADGLGVEAHKLRLGGNMPGARIRYIDVTR